MESFSVPVLDTCCADVLGSSLTDSPQGTSTDLHLVDVGGVVSEATEGGDGLAAAVWNQPVLGLGRLDVHALQPVPRVVAAAALELHSEPPEEQKSH